MDRLQTPTIVTSDFVYLRLIGDRRLAEDQFGKIQIDRSEEIRNWANKIKEVNQYEKDVKAAIVAANNHYGGYGPGTVDIFRQNMDMGNLTIENIDIAKINRDLQMETTSNFSDRKQSKKGTQTSISDFVN